MARIFSRPINPRYKSYKNIKMRQAIKTRLVIYGITLFLFSIAILLPLYYLESINKIQPDKGQLYTLTEKEKTFSIQENLCPQNPNYISPQDIIPRPQNIEMLDCNNPITIDDTWKIYTDLNNNQDNFTAYYSTPQKSLAFPLQ